MATYRDLSVVLPICLFLCPLEAQERLKPATFRTGAELVLVPVTVTDHKGKTLGGLRRENFTVFDEQVAQQIVSFTGEDSACSIGVVLDISGSVRSELNEFKDVVHQFLSASNTGDEMFLLTVSSTPNVVSGFTDDFSLLERGVRSAFAGGGTALIDTVYLGLSRMRKAERPRRALLVLSDGVDNHSRYSKAELMNVAVEADTQIYTVIIDNTPLGKKPIELTEEHRGWALMEDLAEKTGGLNFRVRSVGAATEAARNIGEAIRNQYMIGYRAPDLAPSGKWHRIRVKADVPRASIYAPSGYYAR